MIREILVPEIEKEVNRGETFANLRQVYNSMILASWFKNNLKETLLGQVYVDQQKFAGVDVDDPQVKEKIYQQYLKAFKLGVYNYIKEEYDPATDKTIPRQYFSGGAGFQRLALMVGDETYTPASILFARRDVVTGAQSVAEDNSMFAVDVDLWEADGAGVNEAVISDAVDTRVAEIVNLGQERARRADLAEDAEEVLADAAILAKITDDLEFKWGGYGEVEGEKMLKQDSLLLDPDARTITLSRTLQEPVLVQLDNDFVGYELLEGARLAEKVDMHGDGSWMRAHEFVPGHDQFEVVHKIVLDDADYAKVKDALRPVGHFPNMVTTIIDSQGPGRAFLWRGPHTKITFVSESDGAQLGEVDMAKFQLNPRWARDLEGFVGEDKVINAKTNELIAQLTQKYAGTIAGLLREREIVQQQVDRGEREHGFLPADAVVEDAYGNTATAQQIRESDWQVDDVPEPLTRPGAILTGPWSDPKWAINSLKGGAVRVFNDYEDAGWDKGVAAMVAKQTQMDILNGTITEYINPANQKVYTVPDRSEWPVLTTRVRGLHYNSKFFDYDGITTPAIVEDLVHLIVNNYKQLQEQGSGLNVVIPKTQTPEELKTVAKIIADIEQALGLPIGTVKIILMNERIEMTLQLEEAIWAARKHVAVTNVGRWDKMASDILARRERGDEIEPNPTAVGMDKPHLAAYVKRNVDVSLKRGAEPEGGMVVQMMSRGGSHPETDAWVVEAIRQDKIKERDAKMKFAWVATPQVAGVVNDVFQSGDYSNRQADPYGYTEEEQATLLELPTGPINKEGVRKAVYDSLAYGIGFRTAGGAVAIVDESRAGLRLMQDLAVLKINYYWLWKLARHEVQLDDSKERVTGAYLERVIDEEVEHIKAMSDETPPRADKFPDEDWDAVATSIKALVTAPQMVTWESVVMNAVIDEKDPKIIEARLRGIFTPRAQLEAELAKAIAQKQERKSIRAALEAHDEVHYRPPVVSLTGPQRAALRETAAKMVPSTGGILAADESIGSAKKRLDMVGLENTYENREIMRRLMLTSPGLKESGIDAVILFAETFDNLDADGNNLITEHLIAKGIQPGIKTDGGLIDDPDSPGEQLPNPKGLAELPGKLAEFKAKGAVFTKWRTVQHIDAERGLPTEANIRKNGAVHGEEARLTQEQEMIPIVEPEVMHEKSAHTLEQSYDATVRTLEYTFDELVKAGVYLEGMILKTSMILAGQDAEQTPADVVGFETLKGLLRSVPAAVPSIVFLSGGQKDDQVVENLDAVLKASQTRFNEARDAAVAELEADGQDERAAEVSQLTEAPWEISYSFGRGLQRAALLAWGGEPSQYTAGQDTMSQTSRVVQSARLGQLGVDNAQLSLQQKTALRETAAKMVPPTGGILAADESIGSAKKRLDMVGLENTYENREIMRRLMLTSPGLKESGIDAVILFAETFDNLDADGNNLITEHLIANGIQPGIKTDGGLIDDPDSPGEQLPNPKGLAELPGKLAEFKAKGAVFTKWRTVQHVDAERGLPTEANIRKNGAVHGEEARLTQEQEMIPIVEPEVMHEKSAHTLEQSYDATVRTLEYTFDELVKAGVYLEGMILKTSMILAGQDAEQTPADVVGFETLKGLLRSVPAAVPSIVFLSGGQKDDQVVENLDAVLKASQTRFNEARDAAVAELEADGQDERAAEVRQLTEAPWEISYSFGRGLQRAALLAWGGEPSQYTAGQDTMSQTSRVVQSARLGQLGVDNAQLSLQQKDSPSRNGSQDGPADRWYPCG